MQKDPSHLALELPHAPLARRANTAQELEVRLSVPLDAIATTIANYLARLDLTR